MKPRFPWPTILGGFVLILLGIGIGCDSSGSRQKPADPEKPAASPPFRWDTSESSPRRRAIDEYLDAKTELIQGNPKTTRMVSGYDWFSIDPVGAIGSEMIPVILFRILPELAEHYGEKDKAGRPLFGEPGAPFENFGFWRETRGVYAARPLPMGFAWTAPRPTFPLSLAVRTCGSCHTGRVRLRDDAEDDDRNIRVLVGAPNTEILLHDYDTSLAGFLSKHLADDAKTEDFRARVLDLVSEKSKDPNYFFRDAPGYSQEAEARQVSEFRKRLALPAEEGGILALIRQATALKLEGVKTLHDIAYSNDPNARPPSPDLHGGPPGLIDSSGLGIAGILAKVNRNPAATTKLDPKLALLDRATKNDVPSVWNQRTRKQWQWDGNLQDVLARNLVAALGLVGVPEMMDIEGNVFISEFIDGLPPPPYPFPIEVSQAVVEQGRKVFEQNCVACHRHHQQRGDGVPLPVFNLGTDMNRAKVVTPIGYEVVKQTLVACYQPEGLRFLLGGKLQTPNDDIEGDGLLVKRFTRETQGYVAGPLDGIWARAPYLHNGSVPTLRHLLVPSLRKGTLTFLRGSISFDREDVGWAWGSGKLAEIRKAHPNRDPSARIYDTRQDGQSAAGHDQEWWSDDRGQAGAKGHRYRLSWKDPKDPDVEALLAYLKTL